jgi:hypothetical protein
MDAFLQLGQPRLGDVVAGCYPERPVKSRLDYRPMMKRLIAMMECAVLAGMLVCVSPLDPAEAQWQVPLDTTPIGRGAGTGFKHSGPGVYYATAYGTLCDGSTNDVSAINSAITAANTAGGGIVQLPEGTCIVGGSLLRVKSNVHLRGSGQSATILQLASAYTNIIVQLGEATSGSNIAISDLTIDAGDYACAVATCISLFVAADNSTTVTNMRIERVSVIKFKFLGIGYQTVDGLKILDSICTFTTPANTQNQCVNGSSATQSANVTITRNTFTGSGMQLSGYNNIVTHNRVSGYLFGCGIGDDAQSTTYENNYSFNVLTDTTGTDSNGLAPCGIEMWGPRTIAEGNQISGQSGNGIRAGGKSQVIVANNISSNGVSATAGQRAGILMRYVDATNNSSGSVVSGNKSYDVAGALGTQAYGYEEESSSLSGIVVGENEFNTNVTGPVNVLSSTTSGVVPRLGVGYGGSLSGTVNLYGATSGTVTIKTDDAAGTYNFWLPTTAGGAGQPLLTSGGGAAMTFGTLGVGGGGTGCTVGSGTCLDNITAFSGTGFLTRTGSNTYAFQSATNGITLGNIAQIATNTILGNATSGTANIAAQSMPSCSAAGSALNWTTNTGFGCNSSITANAVAVGGITGLGTGVATWLATPSSANLASALTDKTGTGVAVFGTSPGFTTAANPVSNDGASLGISGTAWSDLFLATGGVINWGAGNVTLTHTSGNLTSTGNLYLQVAGATFTSMSMDATAGQQAILRFLDGGTLKWLFLKHSDNSFFIYDEANSMSAFLITPGASAAGIVSIGYTTAATSAATGALKTSGGIGAAGAIWAGTYINTTTNTVNGLPACGAGIKGARTFVNDNNTALAFAAVITTGGTIQTPVYCDGTVWRQGANDNIPEGQMRKYA